MGIQQAFFAMANQFVLDAQAASSTDTAIAPATATAQISFLADGSVAELNAAGFQLVLVGDAADLEVRVTKNSGDSPNIGTGTLNTWESMGSTVSYGLQVGPGTLDMDGDYEIRIAATGVVIGGSTFNLHAESTP